MSDHSTVEKNEKSSNLTSLKNGRSNKCKSLKRPHRTLRKAEKNFNTAMAHCHLWSKSFSESILSKCSNSSWKIRFWFSCSHLHDAELTYKIFEEKCKKEERLWIVCEQKCLWKEWQSSNIEDDFKAIHNLLTQSSKSLLQVEEGKSLFGLINFLECFLFDSWLKFRIMCFYMKILKNFYSINKTIFNKKSWLIL